MFMQRLLGLFVLACLVLAGCNGSSAPQGVDDKMVLRVYQVPPGDTDALRSTLGAALKSTNADGKNIASGTVTSPNPGQLIVLAPASLQDSIGETLKSIKPIASAKIEVTPAPQLQLNYWSVDALPGAGANDPALAVLAPALAEVGKQFGEVHFALGTHVSGVSSPGQTVDRSYRSAANGVGTSSLRYILKSEAEGLMLQITFGDQVPAGNAGYVSTGTTTTTAIRPGQILVLAQNPVASTPDKDGGAPTQATRLYIVRVDAIPSSN
jgi:hypothetical protein